MRLPDSETKTLFVRQKMYLVLIVVRSIRTTLWISTTFRTRSLVSLVWWVIVHQSRRFRQRLTSVKWYALIVIESAHTFAGGRFTVVHS